MSGVEASGIGAVPPPTTLHGAKPALLASIVVSPSHVGRARTRAAEPQGDLLLRRVRAAVSTLSSHTSTLSVSELCAVRSPQLLSRTHTPRTTRQPHLDLPTPNRPGRNIKYCNERNVALILNNVRSKYQRGIVRQILGKAARAPSNGARQISSGGWAPVKF